ncbi:MAG: hypothetical protein R2813_14130 [Flavobacteriales bacterium]
MKYPAISELREEISVEKIKIKSFQRRLTGLWTSLTSRNCMWVSGDKEVNYLLGGHATELIEKIWLGHSYYEYRNAEIYGIVAADRHRGRYVWVYLYYGHHLWKCHDVKQAFDLANKIKAYNFEKGKLRKLDNRMDRNRKLLDRRISFIINQRFYFLDLYQKHRNHHTARHGQKPVLVSCDDFKDYLCKYPVAQMANAVNDQWVCAHAARCAGLNAFRSFL